MLLTVDEFREFVTSGLSDDALLALLTAAEADITSVAGPVESQTEWVQGGYPRLVLDRPVGTITSVSELADEAMPIELSDDDYRIDGYILHRLTTGTNPRSTWRGLVRVEHVPEGRLDERIRAQIALVQLDPSVAQDVTSERIGEYAVTYGKAASASDRRQSILDSLRPLMVR